MLTSQKFKGDQIKYSIVIAAFNSEKCIGTLYDKIKGVLQTLGEPSEIVFVDDYSTDKTPQILQSLSLSDKDVRLFRFTSNRGHAQALKKGFDEARGEIIVSIDDDLQEDPADIPALIAKLNGGFDMVCGWRISRKDPLHRLLISKIGNYIMRSTTRMKLHDISCTMRAYRRNVVKDIVLRDRGDISFIPYIISKRTSKITEIKIKHYSRAEGSSGYSTLSIILMVIRSYMRLQREFKACQNEKHCH